MGQVLHPLIYLRFLVTSTPILPQLNFLYVGVHCLRGFPCRIIREMCINIQGEFHGGMPQHIRYSLWVCSVLDGNSSVRVAEIMEPHFGYTDLLHNLFELCEDALVRKMRAIFYREHETFWVIPQFPKLEFLFVLPSLDEP